MARAGAGGARVGVLLRDVFSHTAYGTFWPKHEWLSQTIFYALYAAGDRFADAGKMRKDALAAIEQLKIKGPNYKREISAWAMLGQGALAVGCVTAAALGQLEFGLPCVIGGGATSAAMYYMKE